MKLSAKIRPRHDPQKIFDIHRDRAAGLSPAEIAVKHGLPATTIMGFLRSAGEPGGLLSPYRFHGMAVAAGGPIQAYWLGFIAASGRVFGEKNLCTLVLAIHPQDAEHVQTLAQDLIVGHASCEFAESSLYGRQAYLRDRQLTEVLREWGISGSPEEDSISLEFIPHALLSDFVRGYLEGSRHSPPFGGTQARTPSPRSRHALALVGSARLVGELSRVLRSVCGARGDAVAPFGQFGLYQVAFPPEDGVQVLEYAYRRATRSMPRAAGFAAWFGQQQGRRSRTRSNDRQQRTAQA